MAKADLLTVPIKFTWSVPGQGYELMEMTPGQPAVASVRADPTPPFTNYSPFDWPGAFLDLAHVGKSPASILEFANRYGDLWHRYAPEEGWAQVSVTSLMQWFEASERMEVFLVSTRHKDTETAVWVEKYTKERLAEVTLHAPIEGIRLSPQTLEAALWIQAVRAHFAGTQFTRCAQCGRHIVLTSKMKGPRPFCSDYCRLGNYRIRKQQGFEMLHKGVSVKDVAAAIGSTVETVQEWATKLAMETGGKLRKRGLSLHVEPEPAAPKKKPAKKKGTKK